MHSWGCGWLQRAIQHYEAQTQAQEEGSPSRAVLRDFGNVSSASVWYEFRAIERMQTVKKGDPIATVKDLRLESKLHTKRNQLIGDIQKAKYQILAINAQIGASDRQGIAEIEQANRSIAGIQAELSRAERDYRDKRITTQAEVAEAEANWRTAQKEQQVSEVDLQVAAANLKSLQAGHRSAVARSERYQSVATAGAISTNQLEEAQLAAEQQAQSIAGQR